MKRHPVMAMETLESRTFLSAVSPAIAPAPVAHSAAVTAAAIGTTSGVTLHLTAGVAFSGNIAFYSTPVLDPPLGYFASIDWGDGTVTQATLQYGSHGTDFGENVVGSHTYQTAGTYKIVTKFSDGPINPASALPTTLLATIDSTAIVAPPANSAGGVTIHPTAGVKFTDILGSFTTIAPATNLHATVSWGDGTTSTGSLAAAGVVGLDVIKFNVNGTHTYAKPGTYPIQIVVTKPALDPSSVPFVVATIDSTAVVAAPRPAPSVSVVGGVLKIIGTPFNDTIDVAETPLANAKFGSHLYVSINGQSWIFPAAGITQITVDAGDGNDIVNLGGGSATAVRIDAIIHGDNGNDTLTGGAGTDSLYGDNGNDTLIASPGGDSAYGGAGIDTAVEIGPGAPPPPNVPPPPTYKFSFIASDVEHIVLPG